MAAPCPITRRGSVAAPRLCRGYLQMDSICLRTFSSALRSNARCLHTTNTAQAAATHIMEPTKRQKIRASNTAERQLLYSSRLEAAQLIFSTKPVGPHSGMLFTSKPEQRPHSRATTNSSRLQHGVAGLAERRSSLAAIAATAVTGRSPAPSSAHSAPSRAHSAQQRGPAPRRDHIAPRCHRAGLRAQRDAAIAVGAGAFRERGAELPVNARLVAKGRGLRLSLNMAAAALPKMAPRPLPPVRGTPQRI